MEAATQVVTEQLFADAPEPGETVDIDLGGGLRGRSDRARPRRQQTRPSPNDPCEKFLHVGLAVNPGTPIARVIDMLDDIDWCLVMTGEARWTRKAAIDQSVPAAIRPTASGERYWFSGEAEFASRLVAALRFPFVGHEGKRP